MNLVFRLRPHITNAPSPFDSVSEKKNEVIFKLYRKIHKQHGTKSNILKQVVGQVKITQEELNNTEKSLIINFKVSSKK
jgi:hypothetical protein